MNNIIWMCWFQGEYHSDLPKLNKKCIQRWRELNPTWQVNVLSDKTIADYVPEYFNIIKNSPIRRTAANSDLLRILLLSKYGGVWVDASVYPMLPLSDFISDILNDVGFFSYRFVPRGSYLPRHGMCEIVSWFLCVDSPKHYIIEKWKNRFISIFKKNKTWKILTFHQTLTDLYDEDEQVKYVIDNMVQINEKIPSSALRRLEPNEIKPSYVYKRPKLARLGLVKKHTKNNRAEQNLSLQNNSPKDSETFRSEFKK